MDVGFVGQRYVVYSHRALLRKSKLSFFGTFAKYVQCSNSFYSRVDWSTAFTHTPWDFHLFCSLASWLVWTSLHCNSRVSIFCGLWTLEIQQQYCPNKTKCSSWNCLVVLYFCWYKIMHRIIVTLFWGYQYCLNYHSFSQKGYHFTYQRNTHMSLLNEKKLLNRRIPTNYKQEAGELAATKNGEISTKSGQNTNTNLRRKW